jgi:transcriptional regulator with XRE-family HTH domain
MAGRLMVAPEDGQQGRDAQALAARFLAMRNALGYARQEDLAEALRRSRNTVSSYERGKQIPDGESLMRLADLGINIQWLLTGDGPMLARDRERPAPGADAGAATRPLDGDLMGRIVDTIRAVYRAEGQGLPDRSLGEMAAEWYGAITAEASAPGDRLDALAERQIALRRRLRAAAHNPTAGKRPA